MMIKGKEIVAKNGRRPYPLDGRQLLIEHFVVRITTPDNPFKAHKHERAELWFIIDGQALVSLDGHEHAVAGGDLIVIDPQVEHGLRTENQTTWICLG
jgi:mannose-6-phosphate isomerase-like protein (cupin superfamily)